jgi:hypothetical protein
MDRRLALRAHFGEAFNATIRDDIGGLGFDCSFAGDSFTSLAPQRFCVRRVAKYSMHALRHACAALSIENGMKMGLRAKSK